MDFDLTGDQDELRQVTRAFLDKKSTEADVRRAIDSAAGYDEAAWQQFAEQVGLTGILVPEDNDGLGLGLTDAGVVLEEMGRRLFASPFLSSSVIAVSALRAAGDPAFDEVLGGIAEGSTIATLASVEASGDWSPTAVAATAVPAGDGWALSGEKAYVLDAETADLFLVTATTPDGAVALFAVDAASAAVEPSETLDLTRSLARVRFDAATARLVGDAASGASYVADALAAGAAALAAEQVGAARQCLDSAVDYANSRVQFGATIGTFQAVQHRLADMLVEIEAAHSAVYYALWAAQEQVEGWQGHARVAKIIASEALSYAAAESLHLHGGNGFTWEFPEHLYFRRARSSELLLGSPTFHRQQLAIALGL